MSELFETNVSIELAIPLSVGGELLEFRQTEGRLLHDIDLRNVRTKVICRDVFLLILKG